MEVCRRSSWLLLLLGVSLLANILQGVQGEVESEGPSESECRPYIEKALKELEIGESDTTHTPETEDSKEDSSTVEVTTDDSDRQEGEGDNDTHEEGTESIEDDQNIEDDQQVGEGTQEETTEEESEKTSPEDVDNQEGIEDNEEAVTSGETKENVEDEDTEEHVSKEKDESQEGGDGENQEGEDARSQDDGETEETTEDEEVKERVERDTAEAEQTEDESREEIQDTNEDEGEEEKVLEQEAESVEEAAEQVDQETQKAAETEENEESQQEEKDDTQEDVDGDQESQSGEQEGEGNEQEDEVIEQESEGGEQDDGNESAESQQTENIEEAPQTSQEEEQGTDEQVDEDTREDETKEDEGTEEEQDTKSEDDKSDTKEDEKDETNEEQEGGSPETETAGEPDERSAEKDDDSTDKTASEENREGESQKESTEVLEANEEDKSQNQDTDDKDSQERESEAQGDGGAETTEEDSGSGEDDEEETAPVEELSLDVDIPSELRDRNHVEHLLKLDDEASETEKIINRVAEITLRELKKLYENAIKPLEVLYKYRDLSNRHFGDAEIFSKPLILFMGPWSGGKSSIINYLLDNEYNETSLRTGAEPSPAYFNILMYGEEPEIWDGTQLAADFTFSGLQKFGQGLEERLRGVRLPSKLLEKVNVVEIPGILEVRKQVSRVFPFNDACQWFIDRADIIFLVYDPSKLDVGPETEAILDQLKGREHQTRIILNKADQVKPEELMRVQGALIWNISPLMSSPQPPVMYTTSLWSRPYEPWAPVRLLHAQERAFLRDLRSAIDKRIENKIASARRFAVRVRNHAKMVDCYLTTYYNHKSVFGNRKQVADEIIEHPQDYHIYEGLSTLTNISRYDLPDPDVYRDFFKLNPLYDFQQLSATCTYFRGCPINRLDVAIAYDLPELVGKHKRLVESALAEASQTQVPSS